MNVFCKECHWGYLRPHSSLRWWYKCPICGYSELNFDRIHPKHHEAAKANPLQPNHQAIVKTLKPTQYD